MKIQIDRIWLSIVILGCSAVLSPAQTQTFDTGTSTVNDNVYGNNGGTVSNAATGVVAQGTSTVNIVTGANVYGTNGGSVGLNATGVNLYETSQMNISGGTIAGNVGGTVTFSTGLSTFDSGQVNITGGVIAGNLNGASQDATGIFASSNSQLTISSGTAYGTQGGTLTAGGSPGGFAAAIQADDNATVNIKGGSIYAVNGTAFSNGFATAVQAYDNATVNIYGGSINVGNTSDFQSMGLNPANDGVINVYGFGFNYAQGQVTDQNGTLTGTLLDGTPIDITFTRQDSGEIFVFDVPEPSTYAEILLGCGLLILWRRRTVRR